MSSIESVEYKVLGKLGEGTFSQVLRMKHRKTGVTLAMKRFKKRFKSLEDVECLREIQALKRLNQHPNIIHLEDVLFDPGTGILYLGFELMEYNLYDMISKPSTVINKANVKLWFYQTCKGLEYLHSKGIFHRDIKPENILIRDNVIKLADLGSCRGIHSRGPFTEYIATRWYRPPETLLSSGRYNFKMDIWGAGCVLYEVFTRQPLFPGKDSLDQLDRIHSIMGTPPESLLHQLVGSKMQSKYMFHETKGTGLRSLFLPVSSETCLVLLERLLEYDPNVRYSATQALAHSFFDNVQLDLLPVDMVLFYKGMATQRITDTKPTDMQVTVVPSVDYKQEGYLNRLNVKKQVEQQSEQERVDEKSKEKEKYQQLHPPPPAEIAPIEVRAERKSKSKVIAAILNLNKPSSKSFNSMDHLPVIVKPNAVRHAAAQAEHRRVKPIEITFALPKLAPAIGQTNLPHHNTNSYTAVNQIHANGNFNMVAAVAAATTHTGTHAQQPDHKLHWPAPSHHYHTSAEFAGAETHKVAHERSYAELLLIKRREIERGREKGKDIHGHSQSHLS